MLLGLRKTFPRCSPRGQIKPPRDHPCWHRNRMSAPDSPPAKISLSNADLVYGWDIRGDPSTSRAPRSAEHTAGINGGTK